MIEITAAQHEAHALLAENRWNRIVVDIAGLQSRFAAWELLEFAKGLSADVPESVRVALIARPDQAKQARLIQSVARNDGLFMTFFLDAEEAITWVKGIPLLKPIKPQPAGHLVNV
jgi:hypothetical protein